MTYKFYRSKITMAGQVPDGLCQATLELDEERKPNWVDMTEEFRSLCLPWFSSTIRMQIIDNTEPLTPYSEEALEELSKTQLPSQGFMMVKVKVEKPRPMPFGHNQPPPGLFKN